MLSKKLLYTYFEVFTKRMGEQSLFLSPSLYFLASFLYHNTFVTIERNSLDCSDKQNIIYTMISLPREWRVCDTFIINLCITPK